MFVVQDGFVQAVTAPGLWIEVNDETIHRESREFHGSDGVIKEYIMHFVSIYTQYLLLFASSGAMEYLL